MCFSAVDFRFCHAGLSPAPPRPSASTSARLASAARRRSTSTKVPFTLLEMSESRRKAWVAFSFPREVLNSQNGPPQEKLRGRILKGARNMPDDLYNNGMKFLLQRAK